MTIELGGLLQAFESRASSPNHNALELEAVTRALRVLAIGETNGNAVGISLLDATILGVESDSVASSTIQHGHRSDAPEAQVRTGVTATDPRASGYFEYNSQQPLLRTAPLPIRVLPGRILAVVQVSAGAGARFSIAWEEIL